MNGYKKSGMLPNNPIVHTSCFPVNSIQAAPTELFTPVNFIVLQTDRP